MTPASCTAQVMHRHEMLLPVNHATLPSLANVAPAVLRIAIDAETAHSARYMMTITGVADLGSKAADPGPAG